MDDKKSRAKEIELEIERKIKGAAAAVEHFVDKVSAPEEPMVLVPDEEQPPQPKPSTAGSEADGTKK